MTSSSTETEIMINNEIIINNEIMISAKCIEGTIMPENDK